MLITDWQHRTYPFRQPSMNTETSASIEPKEFSVRIKHRESLNTSPPARALFSIFYCFLGRPPDHRLCHADQGTVCRG